MKKIKIENWQLGFVPHSEFKKLNSNPQTVKDISDFNIKTVKATVPGNFELDFIKAGLLPEDIYFGTNILKVQELESTHLWYCTEFVLNKTDNDAFLLFEGIDTAAEIFIDGILFAKTENMLIPYEFSLENFENGKHELLVHIIPASVYVRDFTCDERFMAFSYNYDSLLIRKAPYMYGWDIMPRAVSGGLWRDVSVVYKPKNRIANYFCYTSKIADDSCELTFNISVDTEEDLLTDFAVKIDGECNDSSFSETVKLFSFNKRVKIDVQNPQLWWPKNYGEPNLYDVKIALIYKGEECDCVTFKTGIRTVFVERTSLAGKDGTFRFIVNSKPVFVLGTNWVPTDVFPSRHDDYTLRGLELTNDLNCNMIRCWGGNVYPSEIFYDYCDTHGIMVWQDFLWLAEFILMTNVFAILLNRKPKLLLKCFATIPVLHYGLVITSAILRVNIEILFLTEQPYTQLTPMIISLQEKSFPMYLKDLITAVLIYRPRLILMTLHLKTVAKFRKNIFGVHVIILKVIFTTKIQFATSLPKQVTAVVHLPKVFMNLCQKTV